MSVALSLHVDFPANQPSNPPTLSCDSLSVDTDSNGVASFAGCKVSRAGRYELVATVSGLTPVQSNSFDISGLSQLIFTGLPPTTADAGAVWGSQPVVTMQTTAGATVDSTNNIGLLVQPVVGPFYALPCTHNPVAAVNGVATFAGCRIDAAASGYKLYAVDQADNLLGAPSDPIDITAGEATQLVFTQQPAGASGGQGFAAQPIVTAEDVGGNPVSGYSQNITLSITSGTGTSGASLTCDHNSVAASDGVATFAGCSIDKAGTGYTLTATATGSTTLTATSSALSINAGSASTLSYGTAPDNAHGGADFGTQPVVDLEDSGGNPVNGVVSLAIDPSTNTEGATLSCTGGNPIATTNGHADFAGCSIDKNGDYELTASSGGLHVDSAITVSEGDASQVSFHTDPGDGAGGGNLQRQPAVNVLDSGGNGASGSVRLSIAPGTGTPDATLRCDANPVAADSTGVATFSGCHVDKAGLGYRLKATLVADTAVVSTSSSFDVGVGPAAQLAFTGQPGGGAGGEAWAHQPIVSVEDAGGNLVSAATPDISLVRTDGDGTGTLSCQDETIPAQNGVARFDGCSIDKVGSGDTLTASAPGFASARSAPFDVAAGSPARLVFSTEPGAASAGNAFGTQPEVTVVDLGGNTVTDDGSDVSLSITPRSGTPGAALSCSSSSADHGVASFGGCAIDQAGGGYALTASDQHDGLRAESRGFSVLLPPPAALEAAPTGLPLGQTFGGRVYGDNPTSVTDDVNTATGALTFASTDLTVAGVGEPLVVQRAYNSADTTGGVFGPGWSSIFDVSVKVVPGKTETVRGEDGQQLVWTWNAASSRWVAPPGAHAQLTCGAKTCKLIRDDNIRWDVNLTADGQRQISDYRAPDLQGLTFAWSTSSVKVSTVGSTGPVTATLNADGHITKIQTPGGRTVSYTYDSSGRLLTATDALSHTWTYTYASGGLTTITDPAGNARLSTSYNGDGKVGAVQIRGGNQRADDTFSYGSSPQTTTRHVLTDVAGESAPSRQDYVDRYKSNVLVSQQLPSGAVTRYSYDAALHLVESQDALGWTSTYTYDAAGNLASASSPVSSTQASVVRMVYDGQHRITAQTDANGNTTTYTYNGPWLSAIKPPAAGNVQWTRFDYNALGELIHSVGPTNQRVFTYNALGNMTNVKIQDLAGKTQDGPGTSFTYDEAGDRLTSTDPLGHTTTWTYDASGHQTSMAPPSGSATAYGYDVSGDLVSTKDAAGHRTSWTWDETTLTRTTKVDGSTTLVQTYDPSGNLLAEKPAASKDPGATYTYDATGRRLTKTDAAGITTHYTYDLANNVLSADDSAGQTLLQQFDALDRLIRRVTNGRVNSTRYDPAGNIVSSTDAAGNSTTFGYNADELVSSASTAAGTTSYGYDSAGNLTSVVDTDGHTTTYSYDPIGRKSAATSGGGTTTYGYDVASNLTSTKDPSGRSATYTLDKLNRVVTTKYSQGSTSFSVSQSYDALGRRSSMTDPTGAHTYAYDVNGNLASVTTGSDTFTYDWLTDPGKIHETYPDGTHITYTLDDRQQLMNVEAGTKGTDGYVAASYLRNAQRQTTGIAYSNGVLETRQLNGAGDVLQQSLTVGGVQAASDSFTYDAGGNPLSQVDNVNGTVTTNRFGYDGAGRLNAFSTGSDTTGGIAWPTTTGLNTAGNNTAKQSSTTSAPTFAPTTSTAPAGPPPNPSVTYDGNGNRLSITTDAGTTSSSLNTNDQVVSQSGVDGAAYTYDAAGNMLTSVKGGHTTSYGYDAAGHLSQVTLPNGKTVTYTYDGDGNRVSRAYDGTTTQYLWDPANSQPQLAIERQGGSTVRRYIYGEGPVAMQVVTSSGTATYFYHLDPQGDVTELTNADGSLAAAYRYDGFGNVTMDAGGDGHGNPLLFQSEYRDPDTQLYYMKARNYDATTGRFTQRDPKPAKVGAPVMSPYAFVYDRPTSLTDPSGQTPESDQVFWSKNTEDANIGADTNLAVTGTKLAIKGGMKLSQLLSSKAVTATDSLASSVGTEARAASLGARELGSAEGAVAGAGKEAGAAGEALGGAAKAAKFAGTALAVAGIGLQAFVTVEDCMHDTAVVCAADTVGLAISIGFTVGCEFASAGVATVACGIIGGALAVAIPELIKVYGPAMVAGLTAGYNVVAGAVEAAIPIVTDAINSAIGAATTFAEDTAGAIVSGFNSGVAAVTSGFWSTVDTLRDAGYTAAQLATTLANTFAEGVNTAVSTLVDFGYSVGQIATALANEFALDAAHAAQVLKDTFDFTVQQVAGALKTAYALAADGLAAAMKAADYAVDEVVTGLKSAYAMAYQDVITVLNAVNYGINQIAAGLQDIYEVTDQALATAFNALTTTIGYTVDQVAGALQTIYNDTAQLAMAAFYAAGYLADQAATALKQVYDVVAAEAAHLLDEVHYGLDVIAGALDTIYQQVDQQVAQIFETLGKGATDVANALLAAYGALAETAQQIADIFQHVGYLASQTMTALNSAFGTLAAGAADILNQAGYVLTDITDALHNVFSTETAAQIVSILEGIGANVNSIALAVGDVFSLGAADVAEAFQTAGADIAQIAGILKDAFGMAAQDVANMLNYTLGYAADLIAGVLGSIYGLATDAIEGILAAAGFAADTIAAIGGAFASFGQDLASAASDVWDAITSIF